MTDLFLYNRLLLLMGIVCAYNYASVCILACLLQLSIFLCIYNCRSTCSTILVILFMNCFLSLYVIHFVPTCLLKV